MRRIAIVTTLLAVCAALPGIARAADPAPRAPRRYARGSYVPGQVIVRYRASADRSSVRAAAGARRMRRLHGRGLELVKVDPREPIEDAIARLEASPDVVYAEPNFLRTISATPNDILFDREWGLHNTGQAVNGISGVDDADIDAPEAWDVTTGSSSLVIGVIDTGVAYDHPQLAPNIWNNVGETGLDGAGADRQTNGLDDDGNGYADDWHGWDWVSGDNDPRDHNGHGTHVSGTIAAVGNDGTGTTGVAWTAKIMPLRVLNGDGAGTVADLSEVFRYAAANGARVVNGSFGGGAPSTTELDAIKAYPNTLFVFAAGNETNNNDVNKTYPCNYGADVAQPNIICVAASTSSDGIASFSNYGANSVDIAAPGSLIASTIPSLAAPIFEDGFESGIDPAKWSFGGTHNTWGTEGVANSGVSSLADSPNGTGYAANTLTWARTSAINLAGQEGCKLTYAMRLDVEQDFDVVGVLASGDVGGPWTVLNALDGSTGSTFEDFTNSLEGFDGVSSVYVRFQVESDESTQNDGLYLDDVAVRCLSATYDGDEYEYESGTSMASPHVAGAAALLFAQDALAPTTPARVKSALMTNGDAVSAFATRTLSGRRLNIFNALAPTRILDVTAPGVPSLAGPTLSRPFQTGPLSLAWSATDGGTGTATYFVRYRRAKYNGTFASYVLWRDGTRATTGSFSGAAGYTYCFAARARDHAGNISGWSAERCTAFPVNDRSLSGSGWSRASSSGTYLNTASIATTLNRSLTLTGVRYKRLALIVTKGSGYGTVQIWQGSTKLKSISLASTSTRKKQVIVVLTRSSVSSPVTLRITVSTSGKRVAVEGLGISRV